MIEINQVFYRINVVNVISGYIIKVFTINRINVVDVISGYIIKVSTVNRNFRKNVLIHQF